MFAVVRTGGKQYRVAAGDKIVVEKMDGAAGDSVSLGDVLFAGQGSEVRNVEGLSVTAEIIAQAKADKVIVFKKRRRHNYRRKNGHRQQHTILRITAVGDDKYTPRVAAAETAEPAVLETQTPGLDVTANTDVTTGQSDVADVAPAAKAPKAPRAKKVAAVASSEPQLQAPLKVEGSESPMVDAPASQAATPTDTSSEG